MNPKDKYAAYQEDGTAFIDAEVHGAKNGIFLEEDTSVNTIHVSMHEKRRLLA